MATRAYIIRRNTDGSLDYIYNHYDGYPLGVGVMLRDHYQDPNTVDQLIALGDISYLGKTPVDPGNLWDDPAKTSTDNNDTYTKSYASRGDIHHAIHVDTDEAQTFIEDEHPMIEYIYVYDVNAKQWHVYDYTAYDWNQKKDLDKLIELETKRHDNA